MDWCSTFFKPNNQYKIKKERKLSLTSYPPIIVREKNLIIKITLASLFITTISILGSYFFQLLIGYYIPQVETSLLNLIPLGLVISYIFQQTLLYFPEFLLTQLSQRLNYIIATRYIRHVLSLPLTFFSTRQTGEITSRFTDVSTIIEALATTVLSFFLILQCLS